MTVLVNFVNLIWNKFVELVEAALSLFPTSPVRPFIDNLDVVQWYLARVNYFVPVSHFLDMLLAFVSILGIYYAYSILARWIKLL